MYANMINNNPIKTMFYRKEITMIKLDQFNVSWLQVAVDNFKSNSQTRVIPADMTIQEFINKWAEKELNRIIMKG